MVVLAQSLREQVALACRILAVEGYADLTLGHVSARGSEGQIWIKRKGVALDEVEPAADVAVVVAAHGHAQQDPVEPGPPGVVAEGLHREPGPLLGVDAHLGTLEPAERAHELELDLLRQARGEAVQVDLGNVPALVVRHLDLEAGHHLAQRAAAQDRDPLSAVGAWSCASCRATHLTRLGPACP